jgi:hypothetical protein
MKNRGFDALIDIVIGGAGGCAFALSASFGWFTKDQSVEHLLSLHSAILLIVGAGLLVASFAFRRASQRIALLEDQVVSLSKNGGGA